MFSNQEDKTKLHNFSCEKPLNVLIKKTVFYILFPYIDLILRRQCLTGGSIYNNADERKPKSSPFLKEDRISNSEAYIIKLGDTPGGNKSLEKFNSISFPIQNVLTRLLAFVVYW